MVTQQQPASPLTGTANVLCCRSGSPPQPEWSVCDPAYFYRSKFTHVWNSLLLLHRSVSFQITRWEKLYPKLAPWSWADIFQTLTSASTCSRDNDVLTFLERSLLLVPCKLWCTLGIVVRRVQRQRAECVKDRWSELLKTFYSWAAFCSCWSRVLVQVVIQGSWLISLRSGGYFLPHNTPSSPVSLCFQAGPLPLYWALFMCCMVTVSWYNSAAWCLVLSIVF